MPKCNRINFLQMGTMGFRTKRSSSGLCCWSGRSFTMFRTVVVDENIVISSTVGGRVSYWTARNTITGCGGFVLSL